MAHTPHRPSLHLVGTASPASASTSKAKKGEGPVTLELVRTPDILRGLGEAKGGRVLVGFAAETEDLLANAAKKLEGKNLDLIVANDVSAPLVGFPHDTNAVTLLQPDAEPVEIDLASKRDVARAVIDTSVSIRSRHRQDTA